MNMNTMNRKYKIKSLQLIIQELIDECTHTRDEGATISCSDLDPQHNCPTCSICGSKLSSEQEAALKVRIRRKRRGRLINCRKRKKGNRIASR